MFATRGPLEAGKLGMTLSICGYLQIVALACVTPRAALFGQLVARGQTEELDGSFSKALRMGFLVFLSMTAACLGCAAAVRWKAPGIAARIEDLSVMATLIASFAAGFWVQALAVYLRSFKREPFLWLSLASAAVALAVGMILAPSMGSAGIALALCVSNCGLALPWSLSVLKHSRGRILPLLGFSARSTREMITENAA
jgi:O-antigen/teichoic acid export membrane protein